MNRKVLLDLILCILLAGYLTGCAGNHNVGGSYVGTLPQSGAASIAEDATAQLAALYPPGHTSIRLVAPKQSDAFSQALETSLRQKGFTLSPNGTVTMSYVLDELRLAKPPAWYLQLRIADQSHNQTLARSYSASGQPAAGFSSLATGGGDHE